MSSDDAPVIAYRGGGRLMLARRTMDRALELHSTQRAVCPVAELQSPQPVAVRRGRACPRV